MKKTAKKKLATIAEAAYLALPSLAQAEEFVIPLGDMGGRPLIDVYIGDNGPYKMIFDTGAPAVILNQDIGTAIGLEVVGEKRIGSPGGGGIQAVIYQGQSIKIGDYGFEVDEITGLDFTTLMGGPQPTGDAAKEGQPVRRVMGGPESSGQPPAGAGGPMRMAGPPPGVLGFWILDKGVVGIDFAKNQLTIDTEEKLNLGDPGVVKFNVGDGIFYPWFEISAGGISVNAHIDTGAPGTFTFPMEWKDKLPLKAEATVTGIARLADGPRELWGAQLDGDIIIGGAVFNDPVIGFMAGIPGVNVGSAVFQNGGFRVDRENDLIELNINPSD